MRVRLDKVIENGGERPVKPPVRAHEHDAGLDLHAMHGGVVKAQQSATFHTGVHVELPPGTTGVLLPKSGLMTKHDIITFGVLDEGYRGEILVHMFNFGRTDYNVNAGDKISQMLILPVLYEPVEVVEELNQGERGDAGFGSTGK